MIAELPQNARLELLPEGVEFKVKKQHFVPDFPANGESKAVQGFVGEILRGAVLHNAFWKVLFKVIAEFGLGGDAGVYKSRPDVKIKILGTPNPPDETEVYITARERGKR